MQALAQTARAQARQRTSESTSSTSPAPVTAASSPARDVLAAAGGATDNCRCLRPALPRPREPGRAVRRAENRVATAYGNRGRSARRSRVRKGHPRRRWSGRPSRRRMSPSGSTWTSPRPWNWSAAEEGPRVPRGQGHPAAGARQGDVRCCAAQSGRQRHLGRGPPKRSSSSATSNLGIAAATPAGCSCPTSKDADLMTMRRLAGAISELTATTREGKTQPADMAAGRSRSPISGSSDRRRHADHQPGESRSWPSGRSPASRNEVGSGADERIEPRWMTTLALSQLDPPPGRRRARVAFPRRRRRDPRRPGARTCLGTGHGGVNARPGLPVSNDSGRCR